MCASKVARHISYRSDFGIWSLHPDRLSRLCQENRVCCKANLALEILKGDGRAAAAARVNITVGTARTHLERIFEKTGVRRQAELVRLLSDG
jgi:hypothetical protein